MKKNCLYILITAIVIGLVCYYLYRINTACDGGLISSLIPVVFTMPLIAIISLWQILTGKTDPTKQQTIWQKIFTCVFFAAATAFVVYLLIESKFYNLNALIMAVMLLEVIPYFYLAYKNNKKPSEKPVFVWGVGMITTYLLILITAFSYVQVVRPVTVQQAASLVAQEYGVDTYQFAGYLDFDHADNPIGVYWFSQRNANLNGWVQVDLLTGSIIEIQ